MLCGLHVSDAHGAQTDVIDVCPDGMIESVPTGNPPGTSGKCKLHSRIKEAIETVPVSVHHRLDELSRLLLANLSWCIDQITHDRPEDGEADQNQPGGPDVHVLPPVPADHQDQADNND